MIKYWYRLENLDSSFPLLKAAYQSTKELYDHKIPSWYGSLKTIFRNIPGIEEHKLSTISSFKRTVNIAVKKHYLLNWKNLISKQDGKLDSYSTFKANFGLEKYLLIMNNFEQRRIFTRMRISAHSLQIEHGRYQGVPRQERRCLRCTSSQVEDEKHFLFVCNKFTDDRSNMLQIIHNVCPNFQQLSHEHQLIWVMNTENCNILSSVAKFILNNMK